MSTHQQDYTFEASILSNSQFRRFRALAVCNSLDEHELIQLFASMEYKRVNAGATIYEAGELSNHTMNLIIQGAVSVTVPENNVCAILGEGDHFGLFSFLDEQRRHAATVMAIHDLELLSLSRASFNLIRLEEPELGTQMLHFMFYLLSDKALKLEHEYRAVRRCATDGNY